MGFDVSEKITPELAAFMQLPSDQKATRNAVTQYITEYIRQNKLQDMTERKNINLNTDLTALFKLTLEKDQTQLTYFNLQKHINALFS
jgi:chromatin remodeling complex protein RSC6